MEAFSGPVIDFSFEAAAVNAVAVSLVAFSLYHLGLSRLTDKLTKLLGKKK
jgi:hypothetical protein